MIKFINTHISEIAYAAVVVATVTGSMLITNFLHKRFVNSERKRLGKEVSSSINLIKRLVNGLLLVLGAVALTFIFADEAEYNALKDDFKLVIYLGVLAVLTIVAATTLNLWFKKAIEQRVLSHEDPTSFKFLRYVAVFCVYLTGTLFGLLAIPSLHAVAQTALGGAGVLALIIGVSSQEALSNLIGGMFIIIFKPFKIGDIVSIDDIMEGTVTDITLRHTVIRTWKNRMVVIPNSIINKEKLINHDLGERKCCEYIEMGISYDSDVDLAKKIMREECENHPLILDNRNDVDKAAGLPVVKVSLVAFADSSVNLRAWAWAENLGHAVTLKRDVFETIKKRFDAEGIEIPFPYRTVVMKGAENKK